MATQQTSAAGRLLVAPSVILLFVWMIVPLAMTLYFSAVHYSLLDPDNVGFVGLQNYAHFLSDPDFVAALINTLILVGSVLVISVVGGILVALLMDQPVFGQNVVRVMVIAPFFVMPTVSALVWKNLLMNPDSGLFAWIARSLGLADRLVHQLSDALGHPGRVVAMAAVREPDSVDCAAIARRRAEGGGAARRRRRALLFCLHRAAAHRPRDHSRHPDRDDFPAQRVRRDLRDHHRRPGRRHDQIPFLIYKQSLLNYDVGGASAGGIVAVVLANIVAIFLMRIIGRNLEG